MLKISIIESVYFALKETFYFNSNAILNIFIHFCCLFMKRTFIKFLMCAKCEGPTVNKQTESLKCMQQAGLWLLFVWRRRTQWLKRTGVCILSSWITIVNIKKCYACIAKIFKSFRKEWDEKWKKYPYPSSQFIPLKMIALLIFL